MNDRITSWIQTFTVIGVNIAMFGLLISMYVSNTHRIDQSNSRLDQMNQRLDAVQMMIYDSLNVLKK